MKRILMTKAGFEMLKKKEEDLRKRRPDVVKTLAKARDMGDLKENGYYRAAKMELTDIDRELRLLSFQIRAANVVRATETSTGAIGTRVTVRSVQGEQTYAIVGELEANPLEKKLSSLSPIGKALLGKRTGDTVIVETPNGQTAFKIVKITLQ